MGFPTFHDLNFSGVERTQKRGIVKESSDHLQDHVEELGIIFGEKELECIHSFEYLLDFEKLTNDLEFFSTVTQQRHRLFILRQLQLENYSHIIEE
jgi:hypothetical protein